MLTRIKYSRVSQSKILQSAPVMDKTGISWSGDPKFGANSKKYLTEKYLTEKYINSQPDVFVINKNQV